jgi:hypothetical protein
MVSSVNYPANNALFAPTVKSAASGYQANSAATTTASSANDSVDASGNGSGVSTYDSPTLRRINLKVLQTVCSSQVRLMLFRPFASKAELLRSAALMPMVM